MHREQPQSEQSRGALAPLRRQARDAEARLERLTAERAAIERALADPRLYEKARGTEIEAVNARLGAIARLTADAEAAWLAAQEALEA